MQAGQQGSFVFVVKPDQTVELRNVVVNRTAAAETIIASGLEPGETVVTDGHLRLVPGKISVKGQAAGLHAVGRLRPMNLSSVFIPPVTTTLVMLGILVFGTLAYQELPVADLPSVDFPTIRVPAWRPEPARKRWRRRWRCRSRSSSPPFRV